MPSSGKRLEHIAREIERRFLPEGWEALINQRVFDNSGIQIAEFDIVVKGNLGVTPFKWLIECRDRGSKKKTAPGSWIEQLIGRKHLFKFDKVTAVSTTGFSKGAKGLAELGNIELRSVKTITEASVADWFPLSTVEVFSVRFEPVHVSFAGIGDNDQVYKEVQDLITSSSTPLNARMPLNPETNKPLDLVATFYARVLNEPRLMNDLETNGKPQPIKCILKYPNPSQRCQFATSAGRFQVTEISFNGTLLISKTVAPIAQATEYYKTSTDESVAQSVRFTTPLNSEQSVDFYFHNLGEDDKTFISARVRMTDESS